MKYTIKKGKHSAFNLKRFIPFFWKKFKRKKLTFTGQITNLYNTQGDNDLRGDLNKFFGVNLTAFKASNTNSIMTGYRSNDEVYEHTLYRNSQGENIYDVSEGNLLFIPTTTIFTGNIEYIGNDKYKVTLQDKEWIFTETNRSWLCRYILPWFGGYDNDGNGLGGVAPEDINIELTYKWIKL